MVSSLLPVADDMDLQASNAGQRLKNLVVSAGTSSATLSVTVSVVEIVRHSATSRVSASLCRRGPYRRWPRDMPNASFLAPMVRFISFEIFATGVFERECAFSSRTSSLVHSRRTGRFVGVFAIWSPSY
jgi:hypothetical protein